MFGEGGAPTPPLPIINGQRAVFDRLARSHTAAHREVQRVLLLTAAGEASTRIAEQVGVSATTVMAWRERCEQEGLKGLGGVRPGPRAQGADQRREGR